MQTIRVPNFPDINIKERSRLNADSAIGATTLTLEYTSNMSASDYLYVGALGTERGEINTITTVASITGLTVPAMLKPHDRFDDVCTLFGNKIRVYRAANVDGNVPADGSFSLLGSAADIDADQNYTDITDATGGSDYWYKYTYYNSTSTSETPLADAIAVRGGGYGDYASIESIRQEAGIQNNRFITDAQVNEKRQAAQAIINGALTGIYTVPFTSPINPQIAEITRKLAAGMILKNDYGTVKSFSTNDGDAKMKWAYAELDKIKQKGSQLLDSTGESMALSTSSTFRMYPDSSTDGLNVEDGGRMFSTRDRY